MVGSKSEVACSKPDLHFSWRNVVCFSFKTDLVVTNFSYADSLSSDEELQRLVSHALQQNPHSQRLKDALIKQAWDGTVIFCQYLSIYFNLRLGNQQWLQN